MTTKREPSHRLRRNGPTLAGKTHAEVHAATGVHWQTCYRIMTYRGIASFKFVDAVKKAYGGSYDDIIEPCPAGQELVPDLRHEVEDPKPHKPIPGRPKGKKPPLEETEPKNPPARDREMDPKPPELPVKPVKPAKGAKRQPWDKRKASKDLEPATGGSDWHWWEYRDLVHNNVKPMSEKRARRAAVERVTAEQIDSDHVWADAEIALRGQIIREALTAGEPVPEYVGAPLFSSK